VTDFDLTIAKPADAAQCVPEPFTTLADDRVRILFLAVGGQYLADVNDDPDRADEYDAGLEMWAAGVVKLCGMLADGPCLQYSADVRHRRPRTEVPVETVRRVDPEMIVGLASIGGQTTLWAALDGSWWIAAGYKEPYVAVRTADANPYQAARRLGESAGLTVVEGGEFVPHRVRLHG
jgi:hypothetical protein